MKNVTLTRLVTGNHGTFGRLAIDLKSWWSLERPYNGVHPAIPRGSYPLQLGTHHAGQPDSYPCYWIMDVPGRVAIEIHVANAASQLLGCIAPGLALGFPTLADGTRPLGVVSSGDAFRAFMLTMGNQPGTLTVEEDF